MAVSPLPTQVVEPHRMPQIQDVCACKDSSNLRQRLDPAAQGLWGASFWLTSSLLSVGWNLCPGTLSSLLSSETSVCSPGTLILTPHCSWEEGRCLWGASAQVWRTCISAVYIPMAWFGLHAHWWPNRQSFSSKGEKRNRYWGDNKCLKNKEKTPKSPAVGHSCTFGLQETRFGICSLLWGEWLFLWVTGLGFNNLYFSTSDSAEKATPPIHWPVFNKEGMSSGWSTLWHSVVIATWVVNISLMLFKVGSGDGRN